MKKVLALAAVAALMGMAGMAMAQDTTNLTVQASVTGTCKFSGAPEALNFGPLDPSVGTNVIASTTTKFWCTKGVTTESFSAGNGSNWSGSKRQMKDTAVGGSDVIPYTLNLTPDGLANGGPGTLRTLTIDGGILGSDYTGKTASSYSDVVVLTINN